MLHTKNAFLWAICLSLLLCGCATTDSDQAPSSAVADTSAPQLMPTAYPLWESNAIYQKGDIVIYNGNYFRALWWTRGTVPLEDIPGDEWMCLGSAPLQTGSYFHDVHDEAWYAEAINTLAADGIFSDTDSSTNFRPSRPITRAQFAALLCRALEIDPTDSGDNFSDAGNEWFTPYLATIKQKGLSPAATEEEFFPTRFITRQEVSQLVYLTCNGFSENPLAVLSPYTDAGELSSSAIQSFSWCIERGILSAAGNRLRPCDTVSRAEAAQILYHLRYRHDP